MEYPFVELMIDQRLVTVYSVLIVSRFSLNAELINRVQRRGTITRYLPATWGPSVISRIFIKDVLVPTYSTMS